MYMYIYYMLSYAFCVPSSYSSSQYSMSPCPQVPSPGSGVADDAGYELGHLACTGFAFSCHGLTDYLCQERVEYGWMMQLQVGRITGAVSSQQVCEGGTSSSLGGFYKLFITAKL